MLFANKGCFVGEAMAEVVTEQKAEFFFTLYCVVVKPTSVQQIKPPRYFFQ